MPWDGDWTDPELQDLFTEEPTLQRTAQLLRASRPDPVVDVHYQRRLRAQLMQEAASRRSSPSTRTVPRSPRPPFWMRLRATHFAWSGVALGAALTAATVLALVTGNHGQDRQQTVLATSSVAAQHLVSPNNTIVVAFNQPMDHTAVESGLRIEPATEISTVWNGDQLVITPLHHLAGNTPYTVTIAKSALVATSGARAAAPVQITFGTAPTPPPASGSPTPPALSPSALGTATKGAPLLFAPDGGVVTTAPATGATSPEPSQSPSASPSASPSPSATPAPTRAGVLPSLPALLPTPTPASSGPALVELPARPGAPVVLGPAASAAAFSPNGTLLAAADPSSAGGTDIVLSAADGTDRSRLTHVDAPVLAIAWNAAGRVVYATSQTVHSVDQSGAVQTLATPGSAVATISPDGTHAVLAATGSSPAALLDLTGGGVRSLAGAGPGAPVAFSGDGSTVAWVDTSSAPPRLLTAPVARNTAAAVSVLDPGAALSAVALNQDGSEVAYTETPAGGTAKLVVAQLPSGASVATGPAAAALAFSSQRGQLALLVPTSDGTQVQLAQLPGATASAAGPAVPASASQVLHAFLDAQVRGDGGVLGSLGLPNVGVGHLAPTGLTRAVLVDAVAQRDGSITALASLLIDPTLQRTTTLVADETLTLVPQGGSFIVSALNASQLHPLAGGPHVVGITTGEQHSHLTVNVTFDSDLTPATVPSSLAVQPPSGANLPTSVTYDANTRTATITLSQDPGGALSVVVSTALRDVNGAAPAAAFTAPVRAS